MSEPQSIPRLLVLTFFHNQEKSSKKNRNQKVHDQNF